MFLTREDLKFSMYEYQQLQISDDDDTIIMQALAAAEQEARSYLTLNARLSRDNENRMPYDVEAIFSAQGSDRNPLLVSICATIAKWWVIQLCNADILYEPTKERYDRAITWLKDTATGNANLGTLPLIDNDDDASDSGTQPWIYGSRKKFNHE